MDRLQRYRGQVLYESDLAQQDRWTFEALGLFAMDVLGSSTLAAGLACNPTSPASLTVNVSPGRIYSQAALEATAIGQTGGVGGLAADTNTDHQIFKQGLLRDTTPFTITPPSTAGYSQVFLIQAQFQEVDDAATNLYFYNSAAPSSPITQSLSPARRDKCVLNLKAGVAATTGTQVAPSADSGWTPLWTITVANGVTTITSGNIAQAPGAPFLTPVGGIAVPTAATTAQLLAGTESTHFVTALAIKQAMAFQTLTDASTIAWDMNLGFDAKVTLGGNRTLGQPTNLQEGASGTLQVIQDGTGSRTLSYASCWDWRKVGAPTLSTAAAKRDLFFYQVVDATTPVISITASLSA